MEKILVKESIGDFFSKMYEASKGKNILTELRPDENRIVIYYKDKGTFDYIHLAEKAPTVDGLVQLLNE